MVEDFLAWWRNAQLRRLRKKHIKHGHPFAQSTLVDKQRFEKHPHNDDEFVFTVAVMQCDDCGLTWLDSGLAFRNGAAAFLKARM